MRKPQEIGSGGANSRTGTDRDGSLLGTAQLTERGVAGRAREVASRMVRVRGGVPQILGGLITRQRDGEVSVNTNVSRLGSTPLLVQREPEGDGQGAQPSDRRNSLPAAGKGSDASSAGTGSDIGREALPPGEPPRGIPPREGAGGEDDPEAMATPKQLGDLYTDTSTWLDTHGSLIHDATSLSGLHRGLPICENPPQIVYNVPGSIVRQVTPKAAEILKVGDAGIEILHMLSHYAPSGEPGEYQYRHDEGWFTVFKPAGHDFEYESLIIKAVGDPDFLSEPPEYSSDRLTESAIPGSAVDALYMIGKIFDFASVNLSKRVGANLMTRREHHALSAIVGKLDEMREIRERTMGQ